MPPDKLIYMANQIATFFQSQPSEGAKRGIADHINKFWDPRMRDQLLQLIAEGHAGLLPGVIAAREDIRPSKARQTAHD
jgi:formate dehydrogenase subunit delta